MVLTVNSVNQSVVVMETERVPYEVWNQTDPRGEFGEISIPIVSLANATFARQIA
jgi:hypothetical protein